MKSFLRHIFVNLLSIYFVSLIYTGFSLSHNPKTLLTAAFVWLILNKIIKPILKLLLLPINLLTLGIFSWAISIVTLLMLQYFVDTISINSYYFSGFSQSGFSIPPFNISIIFSYIITAVLLNLTSNFIVWISH